MQEKGLSYLSIAKDTSAVAFSYCLLGFIGQMLAISPGNVSAVWPPSGFALAMILLIGNRAYLGIFLGAFIINTFAFCNFENLYTFGVSVAVGLCIGIGSLAQPLLGKYLIQKFTDSSRLLLSLRSYLITIAILPAMCLISSVLGTSALLLGGYITADSVVTVWFTWWVGDLVGVLVFFPVLLAWWGAQKNIQNKQQLQKLLGIFAVILLTSCFAFGMIKLSSAGHLHISFIIWPVLVWLALNFEGRAVTAGLLLVSFVAVLATSQGLGAFHLDDFQHSLIMLQLFLATLIVTVMVIFLLVKETEQAHLLEIENIKLKEISIHDDLTGLFSRGQCITLINNAIKLAHRQKTKAAVLFVDMDGFKDVNDREGHEAGDRVLIEASKRILECLRETDSAVRLGGDEFVIVLATLHAQEGAEVVAKKLKETLSEPFSLGDIEVSLSASIGIAIYPDHGLDSEALTRYADNKMYEVKRNGKNHYA